MGRRRRNARSGGHQHDASVSQAARTAATRSPSRSAGPAPCCGCRWRLSRRARRHHPSDQRRRRRRRPATRDRRAAAAGRAGSRSVKVSTKMLPPCSWQSGMKANTASASPICISSKSPGTPWVVSQRFQHADRHQRRQRQHQHAAGQGQRGRSTGRRRPAAANSAAPGSGLLVLGDQRLRASRAAGRRRCLRCLLLSQLSTTGWVFSRQRAASSSLRVEDLVAALLGRLLAVDGASRRRPCRPGSPSPCRYGRRSPRADRPACPRSWPCSSPAAWSRCRRSASRGTGCGDCTSSWILSAGTTSHGTTTPSITP